MPQKAPNDQVKDVAVAQPDPGNLWVWASNVSQCINSNFVIHVLPEINTHFVITFMTPEGGSLIAVTSSINRSAWLFSFHDELVAKTHTAYCEIFWPYSCHRLQDMFYPSSLVDIYICLAVFLPNVVVNDGIIRLLR